MALTLGQAATTTGRSRSTLLRAIRRGLVSASRDARTGGFMFDEAELARVFPMAVPDAPAPRLPRSPDALRRGDMAARLAAAEARLADAHDAIRHRDEVIADLRRRFDRADDERERLQAQLAAAQERVAALLTDQRPAPRQAWWRWRR